MDTPATILRHAFQYLIRFAGSSCIIHFDYAWFNYPHLSQLIADLVLIHRLGFTTAVVFQYAPLSTTNQRSPSEAHSTIVDLIEQQTKRMISEYSRHGQEAVIGNWVRSRATNLSVNSNHNYNGLVVDINNDAVKEQITKGMVPIIPPLGWNSESNQHVVSSYQIVQKLASGGAYTKAVFFESESISRIANINNGYSEMMPTAPAAGIKIKDNDNDDNNAIDNRWQISIGQLSEAAINLFPKAQQPVITTARSLIEQHLHRVHIICCNQRTRETLFEELFLPQGSGLMIYSDEYEHIRKFKKSDIEALIELRRPLERRGLLRLLTTTEIVKDIDSYYLYEIDGVMVGAISCIRRHESYYEIGGLATHDAFRNDGIAAKLLVHVARTDLANDTVVLFALTTEARQWFIQHGFYEQTITALPQPLQQYITNRQTTGAIRTRYLVCAKCHQVH